MSSGVLDDRNISVAFKTGTFPVFSISQHENKSKKYRASSSVIFTSSIVRAHNQHKILLPITKRSSIYLMHSLVIYFFVSCFLKFNKLIGETPFFIDFMQTNEKHYTQPKMHKLNRKFSFILFSLSCKNKMDKQNVWTRLNFDNVISEKSNFNCRKFVFFSRSSRMKVKL